MILENGCTYLVLDKITINQLKNTVKFKEKENPSYVQREGEKKINFKGDEICTMTWKKLCPLKQLIWQFIFRKIFFQKIFFESGILRVTKHQGSRCYELLKRNWLFSEKTAKNRKKKQCWDFPLTLQKKWVETEYKKMTFFFFFFKENYILKVLEENNFQLLFKYWAKNVF